MLPNKNIFNFTSQRIFMKKNLKLFISLAIIALTCSIPQMAYGTESFLNTEEQKKPSEIQLSREADDTLGAILGTGNNVLLKIGMSLKNFREFIGMEHMEVPARLFLTDFAFSPTSHPAIELNFKVDCESTKPTCVLPDKPQSFNSYAQFTDWLKEGYFNIQVSITYDFRVDVQKSAPSLAQHLFAFQPNGYRFIGTDTIHNIKIMPDDCSSKISYVSRRGNRNITTATLSGIFYLNKNPYPIEDHCQVFPHKIVEEKVFKKDDTKKFYNHQWIAHSEITAIVTYEEFPNNLIQYWPHSPSERYSLVQQEPKALKEEIKHLSCFDGSTGEEVDIITTDRIFLIFSEEARKKQSIHHEAIIMDELGKYYITRYRNIKLEKEEAAEAEHQKIQQEAEIAVIKTDELQATQQIAPIVDKSINALIRYRNELSTLNPRPPYNENVLLGWFEILHKLSKIYPVPVNAYQPSIRVDCNDSKCKHAVTIKHTVNQLPNDITITRHNFYLAKYHLCKEHFGAWFSNLTFLDFEVGQRNEVKIACSCGSDQTGIAKYLIEKLDWEIKNK
jgi:hypothetical protein